MKKVACLFVEKVYQKNAIFYIKSPLNRDNCLEFFHELKKQFSQYNIDLQTQDLCSLEEAQFILYSDIPKNIKYPEKSNLLLFESELIRPNNWNLKNHKSFKNIFTWNDNFVDNIKYFKFNFTHAGDIPFKNFSEKTKFCTLIAGNKYVSHPLELYSKRIEAINWFEKYHSDQFEFYGMGWNLYTFTIPILSKALNRLKPLRKLFTKKWPQYRGTIENKLEVLQNYKFSICYENAAELPGYITEKIFDSLAAGCVPIYWGAPNIAEFIPQTCYINKTDFKTYEELYDYLSSMTEEQYNSRLAAIKQYLSSSQHQLFEPGYIAKIVVERLKNA